MAGARRTPVHSLKPTNAGGDLSPAASIQAVALRAGVSNATVSRVMNDVTGKVSAATRERVLEAISALSYRPSRAGSTLRQGRSRLVGLLVPDPGNAYHASVVESVEKALRGEGKVTLLASTGEDPAMQDDMLREMRALSAAGIVLLGAVKSPELEASLKAEEPLVFVNRRSPFPIQAPFIGIDNARAGQEVAEQIFAFRHRHVWVFHSPIGSSATKDRVGSFRRRFRALAGPEARIHDVTVSTRRKESAYAMAKEAMHADDLPTAIFCTTDEIAYGVAKYCFEIGLRLPKDMMIFGFDGNPLNEYLAPWLSTVRVPYEEFGPAVAATLNLLWNPSPIDLPPDCVLPFRTVVAGGLEPAGRPKRPRGNP
jgi:LacI family transcriptional regulator